MPKKPDDEAIFRNTVAFVRAELGGESSGHDWWHVWRVLKNAERIAESEAGADMTVVRLAALLHDIADHKFHGGDHSVGPAKARAWLERQGLDEARVAEVCAIVRDVSFKACGGKPNMADLEGKIVQDADRLDAIGAIGIARVFAVNANLGREIFNPEDSSRPTAIGHFHEKLLLLKDLMNTPTAKSMAEGRHAFMLRFLEQFQEEWGAVL